MVPVHRFKAVPAEEDMICMWGRVIRSRERPVPGVKKPYILKPANRACACPPPAQSVRESGWRLNRHRPSMRGRRASGC